MSIPLTAEIFARAIIAAAVHYGDDPEVALTTKQRYLKRAAVAAALGVQVATHEPLERVGRILGLGYHNLLRRQREPTPGLMPAVEVACEAAQYHLRTQEQKARAASCAEPAARATISIQVGTDVVVFEAEPAPIAEPEPAILEEPPRAPVITPAPRPAPSRPAPKAAAKPAQRSRARAIPKGARFENLGEGVSVIRLKPITDSVLRHARQQAAKGVDVEELAELFAVDPEQLKRRLNQGEAA
jgi:hypothetical protein